MTKSDVLSLLQKANNADRQVWYGGCLHAEDDGTCQCSYIFDHRHFGSVASVSVDNGEGCDYLSKDEAIANMQHIVAANPAMVADLCESWLSMKAQLEANSEEEYKAKIMAAVDRFQIENPINNELESKLEEANGKIDELEEDLEEAHQEFLELKDDLQEAIRYIDENAKRKDTRSPNNTNPDRINSLILRHLISKK